MGCFPHRKKPLVVITIPALKKDKKDNQKSYSNLKNAKLQFKEDTRFCETDELHLLKMGGTTNMTKMSTVMKIQTQNLFKSKTTPVENDFVIIEKIGSGAYGQVFKVRQISNGMIRAMKVLNKYQCAKFFNSNNEDALFEGDYLKTIDHSNIIKMYDSYLTEDSYYLILEFVNGGELYDTIVNFKHFTEKTASKMMYQLLSAVAYLHDKDMVHRDIKPENLLIEASEIIEQINRYNSLDNEKSCFRPAGHQDNPTCVKDTVNSYRGSLSTLKGENINFLVKTDKIDFNIVLIDFGACTHLDPGKFLSMKFGTPYYIAPEVLKQRYNNKCDIWSCGIIMHTLLIGHPPFLGANGKEILKKVEEGKVNYEGEKWALISKEAISFLKQLLEIDPNKRISAKQALSNKWITCWQDQGKEFDGNILSDILNNIKSFRAIEKFQQASLAYIVHYTNSSSQNHQLRQIFKSFDKNGDGKLSYTEFREGYKKVFGSHYITEEELAQIISQMDQNKDNFIEYEEFLRISLNQQKLISEQNLKLAFENFDADKDGILSRDEIQQILIDAEKEYLDELFNIIDLDKNGNISFEEFKKMMEIIVRKGSSVQLSS